MDINQNILKINIDEIINIIKNIINTKDTKNIKIFFPKDKKYFYNYVLNIKELYKNNDNLLESLVFYKGYGYNIINKILINNAFPFILSYYNTNLNSHKTPLNTRSLYIFPDDIEHIKEYYQNKILNHIKNLDNIFTKDFCKLSDCILFRGFSIHNNEKMKINNVDDKKLFYYLEKHKTPNISFNNKDDFLFKNYSSFSFNPFIPLNFINNRHTSYYFILNIKKEHNIPGIFLSDIFFSKYNNINGYNKIIGDEIEIMISRNLHIKILKITKLKIKHNQYKSIENIYTNIKPIDKYIKIIYAESLPFEIPDKPNIKGYMKVCL